MDQDIRWEQRFSNFGKAFYKLDQAISFLKKDLNDEYKSDDDHSINFQILKEGLIQRFEYTHELAWNVMKDYAIYQGNSAIGGSRDVTREAFKLQLISTGEVWMDMISSRNKTSHTYNEDTANEIYSKIMNEYFPALQEFKRNMDEKIDGKQERIF